MALLPRLTPARVARLAAVAGLGAAALAAGATASLVVRAGTRTCDVSPSACETAAAELEALIGRPFCFPDTGDARRAIDQARDSLEYFEEQGCCHPREDKGLLERLLAVVKLDMCLAGGAVRAATRGGTEAAAAATGAATGATGATGAAAAAADATGGVAGVDGAAPSTAAAVAAARPASRVTIMLEYPTKCCDFDPYVGICCDPYCHVIADLFGSLYSYGDCCGEPLQSPLRADPERSTQMDPVVTCP